jgi:hypothetical protein
VEDAALVGVVDRPGERLHQPGRARRRQGRAVEFLVEAAAVRVLHDKERPAGGFADLVDLDDVRVLQAGRRLGLDLEPGPFLGPGVGARQDHLQGRQAVEARLPGPVDDAHAAAAHHVEHLVARDGRRRLLGRGRRPVGRGVR